MGYSRPFLSVVACLCIFTCTGVSECHAVVLGTPTAGANMDGFADPVTGKLVSAAATNTESGDASNSVTLSLEAWAKNSGDHSGFSTTIAAVAITAPQVYAFSVTLKNLVGQGNESPLQNAASGDEIQNIEFEIIKGGLTTAPTFTTASGNAGPLVYTNGSGNSVIRFGGLRGGGLAIAQNGAPTFNFSISVPNETGNWTLRTYANPEPGTMALGAMAIGLFGGGYRRRKKKLQQAAAADGENAEAEVVA